MKTDLKITKIKSGPIHEFDNTWRGVLAFGHLNFLLNGRDDDVADVSYDDIQHLKDKLTKIQHKYFK